MKTKNLNKGFTLIEVLLVIALIGILLSIGLVNFNSEARLVDARNDIRKTHIQTLESSITQYKLQKGNYPAGLTREYQEICDPDATVCTGYIDLKSSLVPDFLQAIPQDPNDTDTTGGSGYEIAVDEASNTVSIRSLQAEGGVDIKVNDPLPSIETSNTNTPLAATVPTVPIITNGLVLHLDAGNPNSYPGTGTTWTDLSGNNNNGTLVNGVEYNTANGGSLVFDGVDDVVTGSITPLTSNYSIELCFKLITSNSSSNSLIALTSSNGHGFLGEVNHSDKKIRFLHRFPYGYSGGNNFYSSGAINLNQIYCITWVRDNNQQIYINSNFDSQITSTNSAFNNTLDKLGISQSARRINGNVYFLKIYNRALTPEEIQQNFNATRGRFGL